MPRRPRLSNASFFHEVRKIERERETERQRDIEREALRIERFCDEHPPPTLIAYNADTQRPNQPLLHYKRYILYVSLSLSLSLLLFSVLDPCFCLASLSLCLCLCLSLSLSLSLSLPLTCVHMYRILALCRCVFV